MSPSTIPINVSFVGISHRDDLEQRVLKEAEKLERIYDRVTNCKVTIEVPHRHHQRGNHYYVRIDLSVPGKNISINRDPREKPEHSDGMVAIRDAFAAAIRKLEEHTERHRHR